MMIDFSFSTVLMAVMTSSFILILLSLIFLKRSVLLRFGFPILYFCCLLTAIRLALPFEFPKIVTNIFYKNITAKWTSDFMTPTINIYPFSCSMFDICFFLWAAVFVVLLFRYLHALSITADLIRQGTERTGDTVFQELLSSLPLSAGLRRRIHLFHFPLVQGPAVFLYGRQYYILLPEYLDLDEEELQMVLRHELTHITHHDLLIKHFLYILRLFYWWNPFCLLLQKEVDLLLELQIDEQLTRRDKEQTETYLNALLHTAEQTLQQHISKPVTGVIGFSQKNVSALQSRFYILTHKKRKAWLLGGIFIPILSIYLLSFLFTLEPYYIPPDTEGESLTKENSFFIEKPDGSYDIYYYGEFIENVESLEYYIPDSNIYSSLEEAKEHEKKELY